MLVAALPSEKEKGKRKMNRNSHINPLFKQLAKQSLSPSSSCFGSCEDWGCNPPRCVESPCNWKYVDAVVQQLCEVISTYHNMFVLSGSSARTHETLFDNLKGCPDPNRECDESPSSLQERLYTTLLELFTKVSRGALDVNVFGLQTTGQTQPNPAWVSGSENLANLIMRITCYLTHVTCCLKSHVEEYNPRTGRSQVCLKYEICGQVTDRSCFYFLDADAEDDGCGGQSDKRSSFVVPLWLTAEVSNQRKISKVEVMVNHCEIIRQTGCAVPEATVFSSVTVCKPGPCAARKFCRGRDLDDDETTSDASSVM